MTIKEIRELSGLSRTEFSQKYEIPLNTLKKWENEGNSTNNRRNCPDYVKKLLLRAVKEDYKIK